MLTVLSNSNTKRKKHKRHEKYQGLEKEAFNNYLLPSYSVLDPVCCLTQLALTLTYNYGRASIPPADPI